MTDTDKMLKPEEIINTTKLQMKSLIEYMGALGYHFTPRIFGSCYFYSYEYENKGRNSISFATAVKLHNNYFVDNHGQHYREPFNFSPYRVKKAEAAKIVFGCHLQLNKKTGVVRVSSQLVHFVQPCYEQLFLGNKYL